jgi:hypothetical protein
MQKFLLGAGAALMLAGCASADYGGGGGGMVGYDGFYDNYYGPIDAGYWGDGDVFFYRAHAHGHFIRDTGGHFRHEAMTGFNPMHVNGPAAHGGRGPHRH